MLAYYVHDLSPFLLQFSEHFGLRWYGLAYVTAFLLGYWVFRKLSVQGYSDLKPAEVGDFITWAAFFGVLLGGRIGYMLFYDLDRFLANPVVFFRVWDGGMSSHGGIIGLIAYTWFYARKHHLSWLNIGDNLVVVAPIGFFLGRCANFINGELYGRVTSVAWAVQFPTELYSAPPEMQEQAIHDAVLINPKWDNVEAIITNAQHSSALREQLAGTLSPRHPSPLYAAMLEGVLLFVILWILRTKFRLPNGVITGAFFIGYAVLRIGGEFFREPDAPTMGWLTRGQFLSLFMILIGIAFVVAAYRRPHWAPRFLQAP